MKTVLLLSMGLNNYLTNNTSMIKDRLNKLTLACYKKTENANINSSFKNKTTERKAINKTA